MQCQMTQEDDHKYKKGATGSTFEADVAEPGWEAEEKCGPARFPDRTTYVPCVWWGRYRCTNVIRKSNVCSTAGDVQSPHMLQPQHWGFWGAEFQPQSYHTQFIFIVDFGSGPIPM
jgi:hypothetical protein